MLRSAIVIKESLDGKRKIAIDIDNADDVATFLKKYKLTKKFELICDVILNGIRNTDLYDKENINKRCKDVAAMKFKGRQNARIYCKEVKQEDKTLVIIAAELLEKKKNQKNKHTENTLINKVGTYVYKIEN
jgi:hypothetical protein